MIWLSKYCTFASHCIKQTLTTKYSYKCAFNLSKAVHEKEVPFTRDYCTFSLVHHESSSTILRRHKSPPTSTISLRFSSTNREDEKKIDDNKSESDDKLENEKKERNLIEKMRKSPWELSEDAELPPLMRFHPYLIPNMLQSLANWFKIEFYIKPYIDREFNLTSFLEGARLAACTISERLAEGDLNGIKHLVTEKAFSEIQENYKSFGAKQREQLRVEPKDILMCFSRDIKISKKSDKTFVDILVVIDVIRGMEDFMEERAKIKSMPTMNDFRTIYLERKFFLNYGFLREYSKGEKEESSWIVNRLMHCKEKDFFKDTPLRRFFK